MSAIDGNSNLKNNGLDSIATSFSKLGLETIWTGNSANAKYRWL